MDGANYCMSNAKGKNQQQWGFVKEETFSSNWEIIQWPVKIYSCHFCGRDFKSAQALGGHMNVHRRDRAKLRLLHNYSYPNPNNPFFPFSPSCFTFSSNFNNSWSSINEEKKDSIGVCSWNKPSITRDDEVLDHVLKKKKKINVVNLEGCSNEDLDLELHL